MTTTVLDRLNQLAHVATEYGRLCGRKEFGPLSVADDVMLARNAAHSLALAHRIAAELQFKPQAAVVTERQAEGMDSTMAPLEGPR